LSFKHIIVNIVFNIENGGVVSPLD